MKQVLVTFLALCMYAGLSAQSSSSRYDSVLQRMGQEFARDPSTGSLSLGVYHKGKTWFYNFGKDNIPTEHSVYEIGSITKTFTSLVLARAVIEGKASLTDDIRKYMPGDFPGMQYNGEPIRLVHLANTSSGLPDNLPLVSDTLKHANPDSIPFIRERIMAGFSKEDFFKTLRTIRPDTMPGTVARHSNTAAKLLSHILEYIYNLPIDVLIKQYVLDPLQMKETSFASPEIPQGMMKGFNAAGKPVPLFANDFYKGTGGIRSTAADMIRYLRFLQDPKKPEVLMALTQTVSIEARTNKIIGLYPKDQVDPSKYAISLNWLQYHPEKNNFRIWTDGGTPGFRSYIVLYPEAELSMIFLSNRTGDKILDKLYAIGDTLFRMTGNP